MHSLPLPLISDENYRRGSYESSRQRVETTSDNNYLIMDSWRKRNNLLAGGAFLVMFDAMSGMRANPND